MRWSVNNQCGSCRSSGIKQELVFFFARLLLDVHLLHERQLLHSHSSVRILCLPQTTAAHRPEKTRLPGDCVSNSINFHLVSAVEISVLSNHEDVFLFSSELVELDSNNWQHVRGSALIISMKAIAIAFDISSTRISKLPPLYEYAGYVLCPASLVLGPFVTFADYKNCQNQVRLSLKLLAQIIANCLCAIVFICMSSCFLEHLISDNYAVTYRDALIFRTSHYFISFMSAATLLVSGIECRMTSSVFGYQVTKPFDIELPRSLISVVISWNIPIHVWVKTCKSPT